MTNRRTLDDIQMIYNSTRVSEGGIPLYVHLTSICIGESQEEKRKERSEIRELRESGSEREEQFERRGGEIREKELMDFLSE